MCVGLSVVSVCAVRTCVCVTVSVTCVLIILFNLSLQPESGVAMPPRKPWPPIGGDRRVSLSVTASSQSGFTLIHYGCSLGP